MSNLLDKQPIKPVPASPLEAFLYLLIRDRVPPGDMFSVVGTLENSVKNGTVHGFVVSDPNILAIAKSLIARLDKLPTIVEQYENLDNFGDGAELLLEDGTLLSDGIPPPTLCRFEGGSMDGFEYWDTGTTFVSKEPVKAKDSGKVVLFPYTSHYRVDGGLSFLFLFGDDRESTEWRIERYALEERDTEDKIRTALYKYSGTEMTDGVQTAGEMCDELTTLYHPAVFPPNPTEAPAD